MKTIITRLLATACFAVVLSACGVTEPDDTAWQDVRTFAWHTEIGAKLRYQTENFSYNTVDTVFRDVVTEQSTMVFRGNRMFSLEDSTVSYKLRAKFYPVRDTLYMRQESFGATYALVAPLEKGHTWISDYSDAAETKPSWRATIVERFSSLHLEGKLYTNVLVVKYEPIETNPSEVWIRYYAQGVGPVQTIKKLAPRAPSDPNDLQPIQRTVLIEK